MGLLLFLAAVVALLKVMALQEIIRVSVNLQVRAALHKRQGARLLAAVAADITQTAALVVAER
jgi:hypothetical protein